MDGEKEGKKGDRHLEIQLKPPSNTCLLCQENRRGGTAGMILTPSCMYTGIEQFSK